MALKVSEVIDLIEPNYGDGNPRTFLHTNLNYYGIDTNSGRTEISNLEEFNNKSLFIAPFGHYDNNSIKYNILKDELKLSDSKDSVFPNQTYRLLESERIGDGFEGELNNFVFTNEIFIKIIEADKIVSLIDLAVEKRKLKELIEAVVEIDNNPETQDKLLPKIIKASDDAEKLKELIEASVIVIKLPQLVEAAFEAGRL
jgi:hypothetical protein